MPIFYYHVWFSIFSPSGNSKKWCVFSIYGDNKKKGWFGGRGIFYQFFLFFVFSSSPLIFLFYIVFRRLLSRLHFIRNNIQKIFEAMRSYSRHIGYLKTKTFNCLRILIKNFFFNLWVYRSIDFVKW